jgi:hypothetical protein
MAGQDGHQLTVLLLGRGLPSNSLSQPISETPFDVEGSLASKRGSNTSDETKTKTVGSSAITTSIIKKVTTRSDPRQQSSLQGSGSSSQQSTANKLITSRNGQGKLSVQSLLQTLISEALTSGLLKNLMGALERDHK